MAIGLHELKKRNSIDNARDRKLSAIAFNPYDLSNPLVKALPFIIGIFHL